MRELLEQAQQIDLVDVERDKYFRVVAKVNVDGRDLSQLLLEEGHAVIYDGGTKSKDWCVLGTEEPELVWNPWLSWAVAQLFPNLELFTGSGLSGIQQLVGIWKLVRRLSR